MMSADVPQPQTAAALVQRPAWQSPVPYLFGGLAAMLGLIAFALLVLACSYWKLSGHFDDDAAGERDIEANSDEKPKLPPLEFEEKILVIMAGQVKPTFLATPASSRNSSFGSNSSGGETAGDRTEGRREGIGDQVRTADMGSRETSDQAP